MRPVYRNLGIRAELGESRKGQNVIEEAEMIAKSLRENGIPLDDAEGYVNNNFLDLLSEFVSGGIICRTVREIGSYPDYYTSQEREQSDRTETTFTLTKKLTVDVGKIYPYIDVSIKSGLVCIKKTRFPFRLSGTVTVQNPRITVFRGKIVRAAFGTMIPAFSIYYTGGSKERLIHRFETPIQFNEIDFMYTAEDRDFRVSPTESPAVP